MTDKQQHEDQLSEEELKEQNGEPLPDREVMSTINPGVDGIGSFQVDPVPPADA
jgi:hypothetical protein